MTRELLRNHCVLLLRSKLGSETRKLKTLGAKVIHCPLLELEKTPSPFPSPPMRGRGQGEGEALNWIVFTSVTGVNFFTDYRSLLPKNIKIAAIGPETARAVRKVFRRRVNFIPPAYTTESLAKNLPLVFKGYSVLLVRSKIADFRMDKILKSRGAMVTRLSIYDAKPRKFPAPIIRRLMSGAVTDIFFGSASQVNTFVRNFKTRDTREIFKRRRIRAFAIGPETSKALGSRGISNRMAQKHTFDGLIELLCETVKNKKSD